MSPLWCGPGDNASLCHRVYVDESNIQEIVSSTTDPHLACHNLVEAANAAGGPDNIAVLLIRLAE